MPGKWTLFCPFYSSRQAFLKKNQQDRMKNKKVVKFGIYPFYYPLYLGNRKS